MTSSSRSRSGASSARRRSILSPTGASGFSARATTTGASAISPTKSQRRRYGSRPQRRGASSTTGASCSAPRRGARNEGSGVVADELAHDVLKVGRRSARPNHEQTQAVLGEDDADGAVGLGEGGGAFARQRH